MVTAVSNYHKRLSIYDWSLTRAQFYPQILLKIHNKYRIITQIHFARRNAIIEDINKEPASAAPPELFPEESNKAIDRIINKNQNIILIDFSWLIIL